MELPSVVHPKLVTINGHRVQVVAYCVMSDSQALAAAAHYFRTHRLPKKRDPSKVLRILTLFDRDSVGLLGP